MEEVVGSIPNPATVENVAIVRQTALRARGKDYDLVESAPTYR
jgi:hypothetical protein